MRAKLAVREPLEPQPRSSIPCGRFAKLVAAGLGQPKREAAAVVGILRAVDQAGADQRVDRRG